MTTTPERFAWRSTVERLMQQACEEKVLRGGLETARHYLKQARAALQRKNDRVWAPRINYREAHVYMREAGRANVSGDRERARELYARALALFDKIPASSPYARLSQVYAVPAALHAGQIAAGDYAACRERLSSLLSDNCRSAEEPVQLDANFINLLELSAHYAGFWDTSMEGFRLEPEPAPEGVYTVLSSDGSFAEIRMTRACALAEVEDLAASGQCHFAVRVETLDFLRTTWWHDPKRQRGSTTDAKAAWKPVTRKALVALLINLLRRKNGEVVPLWPEMHEPGSNGDEDDERGQAANRYRVLRQRLQKWLCEVGVCIEKADGTTTIYGADGGIHPDLRIFVACPANPQSPDLR